MAADALGVLALVVSLNVKRRNLTAGQRAVAAAEAWDQAEAEGKTRKHGQRGSSTLSQPATHFADLFGTGEKSVKQARALDVLDLVVSLNVKRRNLTAGQRAVAAAEAWDQAEAEGKVQTKGGDRKSSARRGHLINPRQHFADLFGAGKNQVQQARALLERAPDLAECSSAVTPVPAQQRG